MAVSLLSGYALFRVVHPTTQLVLAGGKIYTYERGTTTNKAAYTDAAKTTPHANPIILDAAGEAEIFWDGEYDIRIDDSLDITVNTLEDFKLQTSVITSTNLTGSNLVVNGSFEDDTDGDGLPDGWEVVKNGAVSLDTSDVLHGDKSVKFTATAGGGGVLTSTDFMHVQSSKPYIVRVNYETDSASARTVVQVEWFTEADVTISTSTIMDLTALSAWQENTYSVTAPATATKAKMILTGIHTSSPITGNAHFDNIQMYEQNSIDTGNSVGAQAVAGSLAIGAAATVGGALDVTGKVGIGGANEYGQLHVKEADSTITAWTTSHDTIVIEDVLNSGLSIGFGNAGTGGVIFTTPAASAAAKLIYNSSSKLMTIGTGETNADLVLVTGSTNNALFLDGDGGIYTPLANGGTKGADTINASELYDDGVLVNAGQAETSYHKGQVQYIHADGAHGTWLTVSNLTVSTWKQIGPTGSTYDTLWTALDLVPSDATYIIVKLHGRVSGSTVADLY